MKKYQIAIIGSGPGGYTAAEIAGKAGLKTLIIEKEEFGGLCLNKGCIPTKTLLKSAKVLDYIHHSKEYGIDGINNQEIKINWTKIQDRKKLVIKKLVSGVSEIIKAAKADIIIGEAKVMEDHMLVVNGEKISFDYLVIATGTSARLMNLPGFSQGYQSGKVITSDEALSLAAIPKTLTVIGGGVIGVEFAALYAELGTQVTILQGVDRILEVLDHDVSHEITQLLKKKNINILTNVVVKEYAPGKVIYQHNNEEKSIASEYTLVSIGRIPNLDALKAIDLKINDQGSIVVNNQLRTSINHIYAIGDVSSSIMLAHVAYKNAQVAINTILGKDSKMNFNSIPSCIYTYPEVASVGKTEEELIALKTEYYKLKLPMAHIGKALADNEAIGFIKMMVGKEYGEILGAHIIASTASDLIGEIACVIDLEGTIFDLQNSIHPHPSISEAIYEIARKFVFTFFSGRI